MDKSVLRREMLDRRGALSGESRARAEEEILRRLLARPEWERATTVALYYPVRGEVNLLRLFGVAGEKTLLFPRVDGSHLRFFRVESLKELTPGHFGIPEPRSDGEEWPCCVIDLLVVPGVAYSEKGYRLGYGGGYYDRVLARKSPCQMAVGVAFSCQVMPEIPVEPWDRRVDLVLTEDREIFPATTVWI